MRLAVITNPRARQNRRNPGLARTLEDLLGGQAPLHQPADHEALARVAAEVRDAGVDVLAIHGGDGTTHVVLTALVEAYGDRPLPRIAMLPGGTMNTVARGIGVRGSGPAVLRRLLHTGPSNVVSRHLLRVSGERPQYGFLFGNGLISNYLEVYYEGAEPTPAKALWVLGRGVLSAFVNGPAFQRLMRPVELEVEAEVGQEVVRHRGTWRAVGIGTVDDIGFGFRPFFQAAHQPGTMHALAIACPPFSFVLQLPNIRLARPTTHPDIHSLVTRRVRLSGAGPQPFMVDGDFHVGDATLEVTLGPRLELVV